jgi:rRNA pseudouridine-1189 N-methylase Emg1 (Nep1/Mra1 family)
VESEQELFEERAAIMEYDGQMSRREAEAASRFDISHVILQEMMDERINSQ